jgi:hypothetical protein
MRIQPSNKQETRKKKQETITHKPPESETPEAPLTSGALHKQQPIPATPIHTDDNSDIPQAKTKLPQGC